MLRVMVCGGRQYSHAELVWRTLDRLHQESGIRCLVEGGATGADELARQWAQAKGIPVETFRPDWTRYGKKAGPIRNARMLDTHPDIVLAFPGRRGTADATAKALERGLTVIVVR